VNVEALAAALGLADAMRLERLRERDSQAAQRQLVRARIEQAAEERGTRPAWWVGGRESPGRRPSERGR